jgi:nitrous oxidase accessory protein NosD
MLPARFTWWIMATTILRFLIAAGLALFAGAVPGKNLYVNNSGTPACSDATTYAANVAGSPWCTVGRAAWGSTSYAAQVSAQAAAAGDVVLITAGTYTTAGNTSPTGCRWLVALNPANSGTSGNLITFQGQGTVNITLASGSFGPTIGADNRSYISWDNVRIDDSTAAGLSCADTGPVVLHDTTGSKIINSTIKGQNVGAGLPWSDNYNGIRLEATYNVVVSGNTIYDFCCGNNKHNTAGVMTYDAQDTIIEHNLIYQVGTGVFLKGDHQAPADVQPDQQRNIIRFNWIHSTYSKGIFTIAGKDSQIYQNVIVVNDTTDTVYGYKHDAGNINGIKFVNNTIVMAAVNNNSAAYSVEDSGGTAFQIFNNIFYGTWGEAINLGSAAIGGQSFEHNVYNGFTAMSSVSGAQRNFATWQATYLQDNAPPAGITSNPSFVSTTYPGGYKLNVGSPALTLGVDILDLNGNANTADTVPAGAYITGNEVIGPAGSALLNAPGNTRFRPRASLWDWLAGLF